MTASSISVVIPVHDGEAFLGAAVRSAIDQALPPAEIVIVDDGSTDAGRRVARELAVSSPVPLRLVSQAHLGPAAARNHGVAVSGGGFVAFLDADDLWLPDKLRVQAALLAGDPAAGYALCHVRPLLEPGRPWPAALNRAHWESHPVAPTSSALLVRRAAWARVGPFDTTRRLGEDADWIMRARDLGVPEVVAPDVLLVKRIHDRNATFRAAEMGRDLLVALRQSAARKRRP